MNCKHYIILFTIAAFLPLSSQIPENVWYFGENAGLDFRSGAPRAISGSAMIAAEGCAVQSSQSGELLFYTDGETIWNQNHQIMPNGSGLFGYHSATQSCIIIPQPGNGRFFYVFTLNTRRNGPNEGLYYSIVDMEANYSLGAVTTKNILLRKNIAEKITAVKHENRSDYWVISHTWSGNTYLSFKVTETGIEDAVASNGGSIFGTESNKFGQMKASPDGQKIAVAIYGNSTIEILDFNSATGRLSNVISVSNPKFSELYGLEFSPDGTKLYASVLKILLAIYQLDLSFGTSTGILSSAIQINPVLYGFVAGSLQLGPDGKIYVAMTSDSYTSVISNPDAKGIDCNYQHKAITLNGRQCRLGLPNLYHNPKDSALLAWSNTTVCEGDTLVLSSYYYKDGNFTWSGPGSYTSNQGNTFRPDADKSMSGIYRLTYQSGSLIRTKEIWVLVVEKPEAEIVAGGETTICPGDSVLLTAVSFDSMDSFAWSNGSTEASTMAAEQGTYQLIVTNVYGCADTASIDIDFVDLPPAIIFSERKSLCDNDTLELYSENEFARYEWSTGETSRSIVVSQHGDYWLIGYSEIGCTASDTVTIIGSQLPTIAIEPEGGATRFCDGSVIVMRVEPIYRKYEWSTGDSTNTASSDSSGIISVWVTDENGCKGYDEVYIEKIELKVTVAPASFDFGRVLAGNQIFASFEVTNINEDVDIASVGLQQDEEYSLIGAEPFAGVLPQGRSVTYDLSFLPLLPGVFYDTLTITVGHPCLMIIRVLVSGTAFATSSVWLPQIVTDLQSEVNRFPLKARLNVTLPEIIPAQFTATIKYRKDLFLVDSLTKGRIDEITRSGDDVLVKISSDESIINTDELILTEFIGMAVLGQELESPLEIVDFEWRDTLIVVDTLIDGLIRAGGICVPELSMLRYMPLDYLVVAPNPAGNSVSIAVTAVNNGSYLIEIYSLQGVKLYQNQWESKVAESEESGNNESSIESGKFDVIVDLNGFAPGAYRIVYSTPAGKSSYPLMVVQ